MNSWLAIFLGGGLGSVARYLVSRIQFYYFGQFPLGTFLANFISCIILGLIIGCFSGYAEVNPKLRLGLIVGFCGGFSTFSTFSLETFDMIQKGQYGLSAAYILISLIICVASIFAGILLGKLL